MKNCLSLFFSKKKPNDVEGVSYAKFLKVLEPTADQLPYHLDRKKKYILLKNRFLFMHVVSI